VSKKKKHEIPPKGTPERSAYFRDLVMQRWSKPRPEPKTSRRTPMMPAGSIEEMWWDRKARELGLDDSDMSREAWRRMLKRLVDADVARLTAAQIAPPPVEDEDADLLLVFLEREARQLRARARRDRQLADVHDREAAIAETRLVEHMRRIGLTK